MLPKMKKLLRKFDAWFFAEDYREIENLILITLYIQDLREENSKHIQNDLNRYAELKPGI